MIYFDKLQKSSVAFKKTQTTSKTPFLKVLGFSKNEINKIQMEIDFKERIEKTGLKHPKIFNYLNISHSHFSRCINNKALFSEELEEKLDYFLTQYEKIKL